MTAVKISEIQNIDDVGSVILVPISVAVTIPGIMPRTLPTKYFTNDVFIEPKYILTASPGKQEIIRRKKETSCNI